VAAFDEEIGQRVRDSLVEGNRVHLVDRMLQSFIEALLEKYGDAFDLMQANRALDDLIRGARHLQDVFQEELMNALDQLIVEPESADTPN